MKQAYVALLRGVNVGGANRLPMERLRALFAEAGASDVETLIQSGNVVFAATDASAAKIAGAVAAAIKPRIRFRRADGAARRRGVESADRRQSLPQPRRRSGHASRALSYRSPRRAGPRAS